MNFIAKYFTFQRVLPKCGGRRTVLGETNSPPEETCECLVDRFMCFQRFFRSCVLRLFPVNTLTQQSPTKSVRSIKLFATHTGLNVQIT